ncbi:unnamed protein product, partial [Protopolystoma xenopodis]
VATAKAWPNIDQLSLDYQKWLNQTGQDEAAAELRVRQKDIEGAINLYLRARMPGKAVRLLLTDSQLLTANRDLTERVAQITPTRLAMKLEPLLNLGALPCPSALLSSL